MKAILIAGAVSLLLTLLGTRFAISVLVAQGLRPADPRRRSHVAPHQARHADDGWPGHHLRVGGRLLRRQAAPPATTPSASALLLLFLFCGLGAIGFIDDFIKVSKQRNLGLRSKAKFIGQIVVGLIFASLAIGWEDDTGRTPITHAISFTRDLKGWELPTALLVIWVLLMIAGASNGVNLTDGLDGLATGAAVMVFGAFVFINIWQSNQNCSYNPGIKCYEVRDPLDLAVVAAALTGACFGFLWWNASPAKIFMGDTGSLSLGGAMAGFALMTRTELLLVVIGGLFVAITASVILQVGYFKLSGGKRIFRMAPLQHHFELLGWDEITIVVRFWIISGLCVAAGLGIFYAEWVSGGV